MPSANQDDDQDRMNPTRQDEGLPLPAEPRLESQPLGLAPELAERVAAFLPRNEAAMTFRLVHKATAAVAGEMDIVRLSQPVPEDAFAHCWSEPGKHGNHPQSTDDLHRELLRLTCSTGVVANIAVAARTAGLNSLRRVDMAAAAAQGHLAAVQWLRAQGCPWDGSVQEAAAAGGHTEVVAWLAGAGCPWAGGDPLSAALRAGRCETARQLLDIGCPVDFYAYQLAASRGQKSLVESLLSRGLTTDKLGAILVGAAAGYSLPDLQETLPRLATTYATNIGNSVSIAQAEQLLLSPPPGGVVLGAAAAGAARLAEDVPLLYTGSEWQAKVLWLVQDKGLRREVRWDGGHEDEDGFPLMGAAEQARRLQWLRQSGFQVTLVDSPEARQNRRCALARAARAGGVVKLRRVLAKHAEFSVQPEFGQRWGYIVAQRGHVEVAEELLARGLVTLRDAAHGAAAGGRLRLLSRLLGGGEWSATGCVGAAGGVGVSQGPQARAVAGAAVAAGGRACTSSGRAQLQEALGEVLRVDLFHAAVAPDCPRWDVLRWLRDRGCPWDTDVFDAAVRKCGLEVVKWMAAEGCPMPADSSLCTTAAARGDEALLRCLRRLGCPWDAGAITACECGVEVVEWMAAEGCPMPTDSSACLAAARRGDEATLRCLRRLGCPWGEDVFTCAVGACRVEVVEWIAAEGCPMPVNSRLHVIAADRHKPDMVRCLKRLGCPWSSSAFSAAVRCGSVELVDWMAAEGCPMPDDGSPYSDALAKGGTDMLDCLRRLGCSWGTDRLLAGAVRDEAPVENLKWLLEHGYAATERELLGALACFESNCGASAGRLAYRHAVRALLEKRLAAMRSRRYHQRIQGRGM